MYDFHNFDSDPSGTVLTPNEGESLNDFYNRYGRANSSHWIDLNIDSFGAKFDNFFSGRASAARDIYNQWYNEQTAAKKAQADYEYTRMLNMTKYQDEVAALKAAGLNPYAVLAGNGFSAGNMSYSSSEAPKRTKDSNGSNGKALGALAIIIAALIKAIA